MSKIALVYGYAEGAWHGRQWEPALVNSAFEMTNKLEHADVIVAHSGGCHMLSSAISAKKIVIVGVPYWPNRPLPVSFFMKIPIEVIEHARNRQLHFWTRKTAWNVAYIFRYAHRWPKMWRARKRLTLPSGSETVDVIAVHNKKDTFSDLRALKELAQKYNWKVVELDGHHDNLWENPETYIKLIVA